METRNYRKCHPEVRYFQSTMYLNIFGRPLRTLAFVYFRRGHLKTWKVLNNRMQNNFIPVHRGSSRREAGVKLVVLLCDCVSLVVPMAATIWLPNLDCQQNIQLQIIWLDYSELNAKMTFIRGVDTCMRSWSIGHLRFTLGGNLNLHRHKTTLQHYIIACYIRRQQSLFYSEVFISANFLPSPLLSRMA